MKTQSHTRSIIVKDATMTGNPEYGYLYNAQNAIVWTGNSQKRKECALRRIVMLFVKKCTKCHNEWYDSKKTGKCPDCGSKNISVRKEK